MNVMIRRQRNRLGVILPIVLVVLVILTVIAASLARTARGNMTLSRRMLGAVSAKYLAWAGIVYAIDGIQKDSRHEEGRLFDTIHLCGAAPDETLTTRERFRDMTLKDGVFSIGYDVGGDYVDGFSDEESKIDLNGLNSENINVLVQLLRMSGAEEEQSQTIAYAALDWKDGDDNPVHNDYGAEDDYYMSLPQPYHIKNFFFESFAELLLVKGMDESLLAQIRPHVTLFPQSDFLRINLDTASETVLKAAGRSFTGGATNADPDDADSLAEKIIDYRSGSDGHPGTDDDQRIDFQDMSLNQKEQVIAEKLKTIQTNVSDHIRVRVHAREKLRKMTSTVEAVIDRNDLAIVQWKRE